MNSFRWLQRTTAKLWLELFQAWSTRTETTGNLSCRVAEEMKLLTAFPVGSPAVLPKGTKPRMFCAILLSIVEGIVLLLNGVRLPLVSTLPGSKIWIDRKSTRLNSSH